MSSKSQPRILGREELKTESKWLKLENIKWQDEDGKERAWECANRATRSKAGIDSVHILALIHHPSRPVSTILIEQYRPPVAATVIEFPAGLIDEGEDAETAALRELHEETGYGSGKQGEGNAKIHKVSDILVKDPGMTGANMKLVTVKVELGEEDEDPQQHLDEGEHIVKRIVPLKDLEKTLKGEFKPFGSSELASKPGFSTSGRELKRPPDYSDKGYAVDALVASVATGLSLTSLVGS